MRRVIPNNNVVMDNNTQINLVKESFIPNISYANTGGKINYTKLKQIFPLTDICCLVEVNSVDPRELLPLFDNHIKQNRSAILYNTDNINNVIQIDLADLLIEACAIEFNYNNSHLAIISIYRSPNQSIEEFSNWLRNFDIMLKRVTTIASNTIVCGDFNLRSCLMTPSVHLDSGLQAESVTDIIYSCGLESCIDFPTFYYCRDGSGIIKQSAIDWIFTTPFLADSVTAIENVPLESRGEHIAIDIIGSDYTTTKSTIANLNDIKAIEQSNAFLADTLRICKLTIAQQNVTSNATSDIDFMAHYLEDTLQKSLAMFPTKTNHQIANSKPWMNTYILRLISQRSKKSLSHKRLRHLNKEIRKRMNQAKNDWLSHRLNDKQMNGKPFFKVARSILKPTQKMDIAKIDQDKAAKHFADIASNTNHWNTVMDFSPKANTISNFSTLSKSKLIRVLNNLKSKFASGPDGITIPFLKTQVRNSSTLTEYLCLLYNKILYTGYWPLRWKRAILTLVPKSKNGGLVLSNLRPISLCCVLNKILEKHIVHVVTNSFKNCSQFGFTPRLSVDNAVSCLDQVIKSYRTNGYKFIAVIMADQAKAFDRVPHFTLLQTLASKFSGTALLLLNNFMIDWFIKLPESKYYPTFSGVPQGSILGPSIFKAFANEITKNKYAIKSRNSISCHLLYADDDAMVIGAKSKDDLISSIKSAFTMFSKFEQDMGITYNFGKFQVLSKVEHTFNVLGKYITSAKVGIAPDGKWTRYLGYGLDLGQINIISDHHFLMQANKIHTYLPKFYALRKILNTEQALRILKSTIYPGFFGICPISHLKQSTITYCNNILRKFVTATFKCAAQFTKDIFVNVEQLLQFRFSKFSKNQAFRQSFIVLYNNKIQKNNIESGLRRWSGFNAFSTQNSWLFLSTFKKIDIASINWLNVRESVASIQKYRKRLIPIFQNYKKVTD